MEKKRNELSDGGNKFESVAQMIEIAFVFLVVFLWTLFRYKAVSGCFMGFLYVFIRTKHFAAGQPEVLKLTPPSQWLKNHLNQLTNHSLGYQGERCKILRILPIKCGNVIFGRIS